MIPFPTSIGLTGRVVRGCGVRPGGGGPHPPRGARGPPLLRSALRRGASGNRPAARRQRRQGRPRCRSGGGGGSARLPQRSSSRPQRRSRGHMPSRPRGEGDSRHRLREKASDRARGGASPQDLLMTLRGALLCSRRAPGLCFLLREGPHRGRLYDLVCCLSSEEESEAREETLRAGLPFISHSLARFSAWRGTKRTDLAARVDYDRETLALLPPLGADLLV